MKKFRKRKRKLDPLSAYMWVISKNGKDRSLRKKKPKLSRKQKKQGWKTEKMIVRFKGRK